MDKAKKRGMKQPYKNNGKKTIVKITHNKDLITKKLLKTWTDN